MRSNSASEIRSGNLISKEFKDQNSTMRGTTGKLQQLVTVVPGLDQIMNKISFLRKRNGLVVGCVVAVLIILTFLLWR